MKQSKEATGFGNKTPSKSPNHAVRWFLVIAFLTGFALLFIFFSEQLSLASLAKNETWLRQQQQANPRVTLGIALLLYVVVTGLSLPGATVLSLLYGWLFGFLSAVILVSFASTIGATVAFLLSRYFLRERIQQKFGDRLAGFNRALQEEGAFYLFTLRLIPAVPFFVINIVMGLTPIHAWTFWWVSQLGMIPGTCVFVYAGASVPRLAEVAAQGTGSMMKPELLAAFIFLGLFPLVAKKINAWLRPRKSSTETETQTKTEQQA